MGRAVLSEDNEVTFKYRPAPPLGAHRNILQLHTHLGPGVLQHGEDREEV